MADDGGSSGLEQFCILAKTAKGRACVALVQQVLAEKKIFVFGELLAMPNVQELRGTEHEPQLRLLELFAYGTYIDYKAAQANLPPLRPVMLDKLRMLTIVTLAQTQPVVKYSLLQQTLELPNVRALEDLIFDCIYAGIVQGKLDQREGVLRVRGAIARDVRLGDVDAMAAVLSQWAAAAAATQAALEEGASKARETRQQDEAAQRDLANKLEESKRAAARLSASGSGNASNHPRFNKMRGRGKGAYGAGGGGRSGEQYQDVDDSFAHYTEDLIEGDDMMDVQGAYGYEGNQQQHGGQRRVKRRAPGGSAEGRN